MRALARLLLAFHVAHDDVNEKVVVHQAQPLAERVQLGKFQRGGRCGVIQRDRVHVVKLALRADHEDIAANLFLKACLSHNDLLPAAGKPRRVLAAVLCLCPAPQVRRDLLIKRAHRGSVRHRRGYFEAFVRNDDRHGQQAVQHVRHFLQTAAAELQCRKLVVNGGGKAEPLILHVQNRPEQRHAQLHGRHFVRNRDQRQAVCVRQCDRLLRNAAEEARLDDKTGRAALMQRLDQLQQLPLILVKGVARGDQQLLFLQPRCNVRHLHIVKKRDFALHAVFSRHKRAFVHALDLQRPLHGQLHPVRLLFPQRRLTRAAS